MCKLYPYLPPRVLPSLPLPVLLVRRYLLRRWLLARVLYLREDYGPPTCHFSPLYLPPLALAGRICGPPVNSKQNPVVALLLLRVRLALAIQKFPSLAFGKLPLVVTLPFAPAK